MLVFPFNLAICEFIQPCGSTVKLMVNDLMFGPLKENLYIYYFYTEIVMFGVSSEMVQFK